MKTLLTSLPVFGRMSRFLGNWLTVKGKIFFVAGCFFILGSIHLDSPVYLLGGVAVAALCVSFVFVRLFKPRLQVSAATPPLVSVNEPFELKLLISNPEKREARNITTQLLASDVYELGEHSQEHKLPFSVGGKKSTTQKYRLKTHLRGQYGLPEIVWQSSFPFDLFHVGKKTTLENKIIVAPPRVHLHSLELLGEFINHADGDHRTAGDLEFVGSREYYPGLPVRRWDQKAWARTRVPHARQFESWGGDEFALVVDVSPAENAVFEARLTLARAIVEQLHRSEIECAFFCLGDRLLDLRRHPVEQRLHLIMFELALVRHSAINQGSNLPGVTQAIQKMVITSLDSRLLSCFQDFERSNVKTKFVYVQEQTGSEFSTQANERIVAARDVFSGEARL